MVEPKPLRGGRTRSCDWQGVGGGLPSAAVHPTGPPSMQSRSMVFGMWALAAIIGLGVGAGAASLLAQQPGRYLIASSTAPGWAWRLDSVTGATSVCRSASPEGLRLAPFCSPWGAEPVPAPKSPPKVSAPLAPGPQASVPPYKPMTDAEFESLMGPEVTTKRSSAP